MTLNPAYKILKVQDIFFEGAARGRGLRSFVLANFRFAVRFLRFVLASSYRSEVFVSIGGDSG
jgi:hypothetical protein